MKAVLTACAVFTLIGTAAWLSFGKEKHEVEPKPFFRQELRSYGFLTKSDGKLIVDFTDVNFLSDNLVLVSINTRVYGRVEKSNSDIPLSKLVLFDLSRNAVVKTADFPVEKNKGSIKSIHDRQMSVFASEESLDRFGWIINTILVQISS